MSKMPPNSDQKDILTPSTSKSGSTDNDNDKSDSGGNPKMDVTDKLRIDGKLILQER